MITFPKVSLGVITKKYNHPLPHTVNTTYNWGLIQPTLSLYMMADSTVSGSMRDFIRLAPLPVPSFARMYHETDLTFVNISDVVPYNDAMLANQSYYGAEVYKPTKLPFTNSATLMPIIFSNPKFFLYRVMKHSPQPQNDANYTYLDYATASSEYATFGPAYTTAVCASASSFFKTKYVLPKPMENVFDPSQYTYDSGITYDSADYVVKAGEYLILLRYTDAGRQLRKVLLGLGYSMQFNDTTPVSFVPLLAFYKAYFDRYEVKRVLSWPITTCYKLIKYIDDHYFTDFTYANLPGRSDNPVPDFLMKLLEEYSELWYAAPVDYISAQTSTPAVSPDEYTSPEFIGNTTTTYDNVDGELPRVTDTYLDKVIIKALSHVTRFVNKDSIIGSKIQDYLRVHYGASVVNNLFKEVNHVANFKTRCDINDIYSTTENATSDEKDPRSGDFLGSYAGKGLGFSENKFTFTSKANGYLFAMSCIVPETNFFQGNDTSLLPIDVNSIPVAEYDCLGYEIVPKSVLYAGNDITDDTRKPSEGFGYMPRYSCYKYKKSLVNGDMSRRGSIDTFSPYYTDRIIGDVALIGVTKDEDNVNIYFQTSDVPTASTEWRYPTKYNWLGNYNRIFYNSGTTFKGAGNEDALRKRFYNIDDNFIGQMRWDISVSNTLMPLGMSYDTFDDKEDTGTISVNKD